MFHNLVTRQRRASAGKPFNGCHSPEASDCGRAILTDYTAGPVYINDRQQGCHEWIIEFLQEPDNQEVFNKILDETLREINSDYDAKRYKDMVLKAPKINVVPHDTFYTWMRNRGKLGGQHKVPRLSNSREFVEEILLVGKGVLV